MKVFRFNQNPNKPLVKKPDGLVVDLSNPPALSGDKFVQMLREGKMPLPDSWNKLSNERLAEMGYPKVLWSKKYQTKYCLMRPKRHDT